MLSSNAYSFYRDIKSVFHSSVTCNSTRAEVFLEESLSFRGVRLPLRVAERKGRVKVCNVNVPYEVHKDFATALSTYGEVLTIESEYYAKWESVPTGTRFITMKIKKPIPSLIRVSNYTGRVFYRGQTPTCFKCKEMGHVMQNCHQNANACSRCGSREHSAPQCTCTWGNPPIPLGETNNNNTINANNSTDSQPLANDSSNNEQLSAKDEAEQEENTQMCQIKFHRKSRQHLVKLTSQTGHKNPSLPHWEVKLTFNLPSHTRKESISFLSRAYCRY